LKGDWLAKYEKTASEIKQDMIKLYTDKHNSSNDKITYTVGVQFQFIQTESTVNLLNMLLLFIIMNDALVRLVL